MILKPHERKQRADVVAQLKVLGAEVTQHPHLLVVRHRGMTWEYWPRHGRYRRRVYGVTHCVTRRDGLTGILAEMTAPEAPEFATRSYQTEGRIPIYAQR